MEPKLGSILYVGIGIALGAVFGAAFENVGLGILLGTVLGAALGSTGKQKHDRAGLHSSESSR